MIIKKPFRARISQEEYQLLQRLRDLKPAQHPPKTKASFGSRVADAVAARIGSWYFIIIQTGILFFWVFFNATEWIEHWDPYPFILLNLALSFQAAYSAPIIMMSQNRQAEIDRQDAKHDFEVNSKAELEIEFLHDKMNLLREQEIVELKNLLERQQQQIDKIERLLTQKEHQ